MLMARPDNVLRDMPRLFRVTCMAVMLVACSRSEPDVPMSMRRDDSSVNRAPLSPPDVASARAAEAAALRDIDVNYPPGEDKAHLMDLLTGKLDSGVVDNVRHIHIIKFKNPVWQARLERYYAARRHRYEEERREASLAAARVASIVVVLATPPNEPKLEFGRVLPNGQASRAISARRSRGSFST